MCHLPFADIIEVRDLGETQKRATRGLKRKLEVLEIRGNNCYNEWNEAFIKVCGLKAAIKRARVMSHDDKGLMEGLEVKLKALKIHEQNCYALWVNAESLLDDGNDFVKAISRLVGESGGLDV
jgi:hypothetical protein